MLQKYIKKFGRGGLSEFRSDLLSSTPTFACFVWFDFHQNRPFDGTRRAASLDKMLGNAESSTGWSGYLVPTLMAAADAHPNWRSASGQDQAEIRRGLRGGHGKEMRLGVKHIDEVYPTQQSDGSKRRVRLQRQRVEVSERSYTSDTYDPCLLSVKRIHLGERYLVGSLGGTYGENPYASNGGSSNSTNSTNNSANDHEISNSVWIGLGVGVTIVVALIVGCVLWCCRESSKQRALEAEAMTRQSVQVRSQMSRAGSVRSIQSRDSKVKRRDYRNSMRASIVDDPQDIFRQSVRSFSKRFIHADLESSDIGMDDDDSQEIYFKGVKCPRRPSGGRNTLHDLYYGRPLLTKAPSTKGHPLTKSLPARLDPAVQPGKPRSQSLLAPTTSHLASTPERPRRKSDFGGAEIAQAAKRRPSSCTVQEKTQDEKGTLDPTVSNEVATESSNTSTAWEESLRFCEPDAISKTKKLNQSESELTVSDTETTNDLSGSLHVTEIDQENNDTKEPRRHHHHHKKSSTKKKKIKAKASETDDVAIDNFESAQISPSEFMTVPDQPESAADTTEAKPKKKKSKKSKEKSRLAESDRRPSRVDAL